MTNEEKKRLYVQLSAPFPENAVQRTEGRVTGRGYDTSGIGYQFIANRLNEVLGIGGWRTQQEISVREITTAKGRAAFDATANITLQFGEWVNGSFVPWAEAFSTGGHQSVNEADARKGAFTNGLKKCAAMHGCGKQAYEGTLDDDNKPYEEFPPQAPSVQRAPVSAPQARPVEQQVTEQVPANIQGVPEVDSSSSRTPPQPVRNRLTSKQLAAIWALARKLNYQQSQFRQHVKATYGLQPEFLDKQTASTLIGLLTARASNGHSHPGEQPGAEA